MNNHMNRLSCLYMEQEITSEGSYPIIFPSANIVDPDKTALVALQELPDLSLLCLQIVPKMWIGLISYN